PVAQFEVAAFFQLDQVSPALHGGKPRSCPTKGIGRHQAVISAVPARWIGILRIIQDRQADRLAAERTRIVTPCRRVAPATLHSRFSLGILKLAMTAF